MEAEIKPDIFQRKYFKFVCDGPNGGMEQEIVTFTKRDSMETVQKEFHAWVCMKTHAKFWQVKNDAG